MGLLWFIPLVSQVVEQVKTYDLRKIIKTRVISNSVGAYSSVQSPLQRWFYDINAQKLRHGADIKVFWSLLSLFDIFIFPKFFRPGL